MLETHSEPPNKQTPGDTQMLCNRQDESEKNIQPGLLSRGWKALRGLVDTVLHPDVKSLYLFTCDQILDTVIPGTFFGILGALSGPILDLPSQWCLSVLVRAPAAALWLWFVILQFCVQNQRSPGSVAEDSINKPWRPIPSGRMTAGEAEKLLAVTHLVAGAYSYALGVFPIFLVYVCLITAYNDFGASNKSGLVRNLFCGAGFSCYFGGALSITIGPDVAMSFAAWSTLR